MTTPNLDIDALERRARAATPGPWYQAGQPWFRTGSGVLAGSPDPHAGFMIVDTETWDGEREEYLDNDGAVPLASPDDDAAYITAANPQTMLALIAALRAERAKVAEARKLVGDITSAYDTGNVQMMSNDLDPGPDIYNDPHPPHQWHDEWMHNARAFLNKTGDA